MAKLFQILVHDDKLVSRIISSENQVTELFVIERSDKDFVSYYSERLKNPALYILVNQDTKQLYVGQTDDSLKRLKNHEAKDFWSEALVFNSTNNTLSKTEIEWLEAKTYEEISRLGYYDLSNNKQTPQQPSLKKNQIYSLTPLFEEVKTYICAAGYDIFLKKRIQGDEEPKSEETCHQEQISSENYEDKSYMDTCKSTPRYVSSLSSPLITEIVNKLYMKNNISEIAELDKLEKIKKLVVDKEKELNIHRQYSCSINHLIDYIKKGYSYKDFEHDAVIVEKHKKVMK